MASLSNSRLRRVLRVRSWGLVRRGTRSLERVLRTLVAGAAVCVPLFITAYVVYWIGSRLNGVAVGAVEWIDNVFELQSKWGKVLTDTPGLGIVLVLVVIYLVGLGTRFWLFAKMVQLLEAVLVRVPLVKTVYGSIRDMMRFFGADGSSVGKVVLYKVPGQSVRMLAMLTNDRPVGLPADQAEGMVAIWLPMSYQLGGYMLYVPADSVEPIDMSVEQLMKLAATAEIGGSSIVPQRPARHPVAKQAP